MLIGASSLANAQDASNMTIEEKCDVIANYSPKVYQRYIDGQPKEDEYKKIDSVTENDLESRKFLKDTVDIIYDAPKLKDQQKIYLFKASMREKTRSLCFGSHLKGIR